MALVVLGIASTFATLVSAGSAAAGCTVTFDLDDAVTIGALQFEVDYSGAAGSFDGAADGVACTSLVAGALTTFNDIEASSTLVVVQSVLAGFAGPGSVVSCTYSGAPPAPTDFIFTVVDASDTTPEPIIPMPTVSVGSIGDGCDSTPCASDADCDDDVFCNGAEVCDPVLDCQPGVPVECDDDMFCNGAEFCDPLLGCQPGVPVECDDGMFCNGVEFCDPLLGCQSSAPVACGDGVGCTFDTCSESDARCVNAENHTRCDDDDPCTSDSCDATADCQHVVVSTCADGDSCCAAGCSANDDGDCFPVCGNGALEAGEECDDGGTDAGDGCDGVCVAEFCGDGLVQGGLGEQCDDGDVIDGDGCSRDCALQQLCGDANDDGQLTSSDALQILQTAVGAAVACLESICDVDGDGTIVTSDALSVLLKSVAIDVTLSCVYLVPG